jgi:hypothetical protein
MANHNELQPRPVDEWYYSSTDDDIILCDPFSGQLISAGVTSARTANSTPPKAFMGDYDLSNGYGFWRGTKYIGDITVGVFLADPSSPDGLGDHYQEISDSFDAIGYATEQSVLQTELRRQVGADIGKAVVSGVVHSSFSDRILSAAAQSNSLVFRFDPSRAVDAATSSMDGAPDTPDGKALQAAADIVRLEAMMQDVENPNLRLSMADLAYTNALQWHLAMRAGHELEKLYDEYGELPTSLLLIVSREHGDIGRKLTACGAQDVDVSPARSDYFGASEQWYARVLRSGSTSRQDLTH